MQWDYFCLKSWQNYSLFLKKIGQGIYCYEMKYASTCIHDSNHHAFVKALNVNFKIESFEISPFSFKDIILMLEFLPKKKLYQLEKSIYSRSVLIFIDTVLLAKLKEMV